MKSGSPVEGTTAYPVNRSPMIRILRILARMLPGDYVRTSFYLNIIDRPRRILRSSLLHFYRYDHVYAVLKEARAQYRGHFSILEFGTSAGYSFVKLLFAVKYLRMADRVTVPGFDSFEGMPPSTDPKDADVIVGDSWVAGQFRGDYERLQEWCARRYKNFQLHRGYFDVTLTDAVLKMLNRQTPILVWIDCDYYSSARVVMERLIPYLPSGCVIYFDEYNTSNFGSRFTGEARLVYEINHGHLGDNIELVLDPELSLSSNRVYRFVRFEPGPRYEPVSKENAPDMVRYPTNGSPLP
jgi:Methyltransferase domain